MIDIEIKSADWVDWCQHLTSLRNEVFVVEQNVPAELEIDGLDSQCQHVIALHKGEIIGTGRLLPSGFIGRMCVKSPYRGMGIGGQMLTHLVGVARQLGYSRIMLNAQSQVIDFYRRHGFELDSDPFMEAGILHQRMKIDN